VDKGHHNKGTTEQRQLQTNKPLSLRKAAIWQVDKGHHNKGITKTAAVPLSDTNQTQPKQTQTDQKTMLAQTNSVSYKPKQNV
jgi:cytochrome c biogenesis protein ResB